MIKSKKHWYSYTANICLILFVGIPMIVFYLASKESTEIHRYFRIGILLVGLWIFYITIKSIVLNSRVEWTFKNNFLTVKSGLLPWKRTVFGMDVSQIYEIYYTKNFMGTVLGFGGLHVRRTDGVTSKISQLTMANHKTMVTAVNSALSFYKNNHFQKAEPSHSKESLSDELRKLADLNKDGVITNEEFEQLKQKLIH